MPFRASPLLMLLAFTALAAAERPAAKPDVVASLRPYIASKALAGAVTLVTDKDATLSHQAIGKADIAAKQAMPLDALFWIASMSKPLTATVLMMLVDEGKVDLEAPVADYLPEFAATRVEAVAVGSPVTLKKPERPITVHHALAHTSGLPFVLPAENGKLDVLPIADSVKQSAALPLAFEPGRSWYYSNCGINLAGRIIEVVTGKPFEQAMRERLFDPLGMVDTTSFPSAAQVARLAKAYRPTSTGKGGSVLRETPINYLTYPLDAPTRFACPGGGFFSTAADLARYARLLLNHGEHEGRRLLAVETVKRMTSSQTGNLLIGYGYGFSFVVNGSEFGHGGAYSTEFAWDTARGLATIFLVQHDGFAGADGEEIIEAFKAAARKAFAKR